MTLPRPIRSATLTLGALGLVAAACGDGGGGAPSAAPPTPGNLGAAPTAEAPAAPATASPGTAGPSSTAADAPTPGPAMAKDPSAKGAPGLPEGFDAKAFCLMPKLSHCSVYGAKYNKLDGISKFCPALGGELTGYCPSDGLVAKCRTPADVVTYYYSTGDKPYTKDTAEAKCAEKGWEVLP